MTLFKFKNKISSNRKKTTGFLDNYWIWMGMIDSYSILKKLKNNKQKLTKLKKQIIWHFLKNFFLFPLWFVSLLTPYYMKGKNNVWTNLKTIGKLITSKEFRPLRIAVLSQFVFVFLIIQFGIIVFYNNSTPVYTASYGWLSSDWSGNASTTAFASHPDNQSGWNTYFSKDNYISTSNYGAVTLGDIILSNYTQTTATDFNSGNLNNLYVANDSFSLLKDNGASCTTNNECNSGICNQYSNLCSDEVGSAPSLQITTTTFEYTGSIQYYTVPEGVTSITVDAYGAQGGDGNNGNTGGRGGYARGTLSVTPGETLNIYVGQAGAGNNNSCAATSGARFNGGAIAACASSGGGASDIRIGGTSLANRVIVAGGGGGSGFYTTNGGNGGALTGIAGGTYSGGGTGGSGGTQSSGGTGGTLNATSGTLGNGGNGGTQYGGGGGGGYYGGGGGGGESGGQGKGGGGGGGSSYIGGVTNGLTTAGLKSGNGQIVLSSSSNSVESSSGSSGSSESGNSGSTTETFEYTGTTQTFTVPSGVTSIDIEAYGSQGGRDYNNNAGGFGAHIKGTFSVTAGQVIGIAVGGQGATYGSSSTGGGGGGGSFVWDTNNYTEPMLVAGGGGGGWSSGNANASITTSGNASTNGGAGGTNGNGGSHGGNYSGGGGAGWKGNGSSTSEYGATGGVSKFNFTGGTRGYSSYGATGGFGGGAGTTHGGGGGGGYSGGGGGANSSSRGGGGGSYNAGSNQVNEVSSRTGAGQVIISYVSNFPPEITSIVVNTSTIQLNWNAVDGASNYIVSSTVGENVTTASTNYTFNVEANTSYDFQVATNLSGFSSVTSTKINLGTYTSPIVDAGSRTLFESISWNDTLPSGSLLIMEARAGNEADLSDGVWATFQNGDELITNFDGRRYFQYRTTLATNNVSTLPSVEDVTITYKINSGSLISSPYDTNDDLSMLARISWSEDTPSNSVIKFQVRTSPDASTWTTWMGPDATSNSYFTDHTGGQQMPEVLRDASDDRWIQYLVYLEGDVGDVPTLNDVTLAYAINVAPVVSNVTAIQNTDGTVSITYDVLDPNTSSGQTPNTILPTFEYLDENGEWITANTFSTNATSSKTVTDFTTTTYNLIWYPKSDFDGHYVSDCQIRVTADDSEAANNTGSDVSPTFVLDTANPTVSLFLFDGKNDNPNNITITASDDTLDNLLIKISNLSNLNPDNTNASSGIWLAYTQNFTWRMDNSSSNIYYQLKDYYGNTTAITPVQLPAVPGHAVYRDISNAETSEWREFIAWATVANPAYGFKQYNVYRSDDGGTTFNVIDTIANRSINYYIDSDPALNPETTYSYKITAEDNNNNESDYSNIVTDAPNGQGGSDFTAPTISNVNINYITPNSATITWDTDEPADSNVDYILTTGGDFNNAPSVGLTTMADNSTSLGQHTIVLTGLNSGTTYYLRIGSTDTAGNSGYKVLDIDGYTFETIAGPTISNVIVSNISNTKATITWDTDEASDSYVYVANNANFSAPTTFGNTDATTNHSVNINNLVLNTRYYFYVASGVSYDKNVIDGEITYYDFNTTADTSPPIITFSNENGISNLTDTSARISWTTDKSATSIIEYGTDTNYDFSLTNDNFNTNHNHDLSNLTLGTTYYVRIKNTDLNNNSSTYTSFTFTTTDSTDLIPPSISNVTTSVVTDHAAIIVWNTNEGASSQVFYGTSSTSLNLVSSLNSTSNLTHTVVLSDLTVTTLYYYQVSSADSNGNTTTSTIKEFTTMEQLSTESEIIIREAIANQAGINENAPRTSSSYTDGTPPTISKVKAEINGNSVTISWDTDENSDGMIYIGTKKDIYIKGVSEISRELSKTHIITIPNLTPFTTYYYQITSADSSHNVSKASTGSFTTLSPTDDFINNAVSSSINLDDLEGADAENLFLTSLKNATDLIKNMSTKVGLGALDSALSVQNTLLSELSKLLPTPVVSGQPVVNVTSNSATIAWNTDKESNSLVSFSSEDTYRASALYDQTIGENNEFVLNHLVEIKNLLPDTRYHYSLISRTNTGAEIRSQDFNFKTNPEANEILNYSVDIISPAEVLFSWQTNLPTASAISFTPYRNGILDVEAKQTINDKSFTLNHTLKLDSLEAGVIYDIELAGKDINEKILSKTIKGFSSEKENLPPIISQIQTDSAIIPGEKERIQVIISWLTNELSTSRVLYQKGFSQDKDTSLSDSSEIDSNYTKKHVVVINDFDPGAVYQFQVESIDSSGNSSLSKTINILTPQKEESVFQVIFGSFQNMFSWVGKLKS